MNSEVSHYRTRLLDSLSEISQQAWDDLVQQQDKPNPFLSYAFLHAMHESGSASANTGWKPCYISIWKDEELVAAMPLYEKSHSYGEYVFDWAWANAYHQHGLHYYPKLLSAIPFTPVEGSRLLFKDAAAFDELLKTLLQYFGDNNSSSIHILFPSTSNLKALQQTGFMIREGVQFHWENQNFHNFEDFLTSLNFKKRKNIRAERRKVREAGISFKHIEGKNITEDDWRFFKRCYDQTYALHHSTPYLNLDFFLRIGRTMPENIHLILANRSEQAIAASLLIHDHNTVYGRYWGCLEQVACLHFETAYYQSIEFCITNKKLVFEGGAQGEHKMARGFLPTKTFSAHKLAEPAFADAVAHYLERERSGIDDYLDELNERNPFKRH